jgi:hypothetical protein
LWILLLAWPLPVPAQPTTRSDEEVLAEADAAFRHGVENRTRILVARQHFADAAERYGELHRRGVRSPALCLKLGNAATLADRWPEAIWAYHVGLKLDANDAQLRDHLAFVRAKVIYPPANLGRPQADVWPAPLPRPTEYDLILIGAVAYLLACVLGMIGYLRGSMRLFLGASALVLIAASAGVGYWHASQQAALNHETPLVVLTHNTPFYRGNSTSYPQHPILPMLPRGMEVRRLHARGGWLQVRLSTGEVGWVPANVAMVVEP